MSANIKKIYTCVGYDSWTYKTKYGISFSKENINKFGASLTACNYDSKICNNSHELELFINNFLLLARG